MDTYLDAVLASTLLDTVVRGTSGERQKSMCDGSDVNGTSTESEKAYASCLASMEVGHEAQYPTEQNVIE